MQPDILPIVSALLTTIVVVIMVRVLASRSRVAHAAATAETGVAATFTTVAVRPQRAQVAALSPAFGAGTPARNTFQRPVVVLDAAELRLTLDGGSSSAYLRIPRTALRWLETAEVQDRALRTTAIRAIVATAAGDLPLDLVVIDPANPTAVAGIEEVEALLERLRVELALTAP